MKRNIQLTMLSSLVLGSFGVQAAGTLVPEMSQMSVSTAGAGGAAVAENASVAYSNPAGMSYLDKRSLSVNMAGMDLNIRYHDDRSDVLSSGNAGGFQPYGSMYFVEPISDQLHVGLSLVATGGSTLDYGTTYAGQIELNNLQFSVMQLNPAISFQVNDKLSVGAGIQMDYASFEQSLARENIDIETDSIALGFNLGLMYQLNDSHRLGLSYRSRMKHDLTGMVNSSAGFKGEVGLNIVNPAQLELSGLHQLNQPLSLVWSLGFEEWSENDSTRIDINDNEIGQIQRGFDDVWTAAVGARYQVTPAWRLEGGVGYASSPLDDLQLQSADLPVDEQYRYSIGATYHWSQRITVNGYYSYVDYGKPEIDGKFMTGEFDNSNQFFGVMVNVSF
ncbi:outer membrane protein transport protein [Photobacterium sp. SDRW27]|uniref:OmpP1/FadL family transporter n=1 Tax=Photobacterium obscurum TaxID=2829490 RepID=UPI0022446AC9|nr:outer membrane protein transport protein [Photobacterium obscurum]MCW8327450.1 outer membrane protein transport protein [Photobacterium obscurum]